MLFAFSTVQTWTDKAKAKMGETAGALVQNEAMAPNCSISQYNCYILGVVKNKNKKLPVSLKS